MILDYEISHLVPYINWPYFYHAWQLRQPEEQERMRAEAVLFLSNLEGRYKAHALFLLKEAYSEGDDIVLEGGERIALLRQQKGTTCLCLSDFIAPKPSSPNPSSSNRIGIFATSADMGLETDFDGDPYRKMLAQLLADRLAEAAAECMHEEVRKHYWGYAPEEQLSMDELHLERFQGIRPAVGYPSLPDASLNFVIDRLIDMKQIGIRLTESGAMRPHASVSGLMMAHPQARYFDVGKIGPDQLSDYARRRGLPIEVVKKFLVANL